MREKMVLLQKWLNPTNLIAFFLAVAIGFFIIKLSFIGSLLIAASALVGANLPHWIRKRRASP